MPRLFANWRRSLPLFLLASLAASTPSMASEIVNEQLDQPSAPDLQTGGALNVTLGLGAGYAPRFEGAKRYHFVPVPYGSISYGALGLSADGLTANLIKTSGFRVGLLLGYANGRDQSDDPHLQGLGDISPSVQMGGFAAYQWDAFEIRGQLRQAVTHFGNGMTGSLGLTYALHPAAGWSVKLGPQLGFADDDHMKKFFGVTAGQSSNSGLKAYTIGGGLENISFGVNATYQLTTHWLLFGIARVSEIVSDAADSPIVQSKSQAFGGAGLAYHF